MHILVTGYDGFIGKNLVERLVQEDWSIDGWDVYSSKKPSISKYDWVIHLGMCPGSNSTDTEFLLKQNFDLSQWLFNECRHHEVNFQFTSTCEVYGADFSEYASTDPSSPYAWSKFLFDRWVFQQEHTALVQGFRYFTVYGKYQHLCESANLIEQWKEQAKTTKTIIVPSNAVQAKHDFVSVEDVCTQHVNFIKHVNGSGIWNIGSGRGYNLMAIASIIASQTGAKVITDTSTIAKRKVVADLTLLKQTIGKCQWHDLIEYLGT